MRTLLLGLLLAVRPVTAMADRLPEPAEAAPLPVPEPTPAVEPAPAPPSPVADPGGGMPAEPPIADGAYDPATATPPAGARLMLSDLTVFRLNPLGLETRARIGVQKQLYASSKPISRTNFWFAGLYPKLNPAAAQLAGGGEIQPLSIFNLRAFAEVQQYFGTFGYLQSFPSANANYSDQRLKDLRDSTTLAPQSATMLHASIQPMVMMKLGAIAVRSLFQLDYWDFAVRDGDTTAYEGTFDTLLPDQGWTLAIDTDVLYTGIKNVAIGLRHSLVHPYYTARHFENQADRARYDGENAHQRAGLFAAYTFHDRGPSAFNKPTVILIASWYLTHRWRTGEPDTLPPGGRSDDYTSRAFPYLLVGFAFETDLLAVD